MTNAYKLESRERPSQTLAQTQRTVKVDQSLERLSWLMDDLIKIPGINWRFGLDALVGLIPGFGDTATSLVSFYILVAAVRYRVPKVTLLRMGLNIAIDYLVGSFPVVGDIFDAWWKSNQMNVALLSKRATVSAEEARKGKLSDWLFVGLIIFVLAGLAIGSAVVSVYLLYVLSGQFSKALAP
ncbi:MAG: DUF4112 domain-containing protein [Acidobacteriota bacterium]